MLFEPDFRECINAWHYTGSSYICDPPVLDTDIDIVCLVDNVENAEDILIDLGWSKCGENYKWESVDTFVALRKDKYNYILVEDFSVYNQWEAATELAKKRNLLDKRDRIKLFDQIVRKKNAD